MDESLSNKKDVKNKATGTDSTTSFSSITSSSDASVQFHSVASLNDSVLRKDAQTSTEIFSSKTTLHAISEDSSIEENDIQPEPATTTAEKSKVSKEALLLDKATSASRVVSQRIPRGFDVVRSDESLEEIKERTIRFSLSDTDHTADQKSPALPNAAKPLRKDFHGDLSADEGDAISNSNLQTGDVFVYMIIPPDGGCCSWFIVLMSFLCQVVVDGIIFSIGGILPHVAKEFNEPGSKVVLVAAMQIGCYFLFGAFASAFINKYGFRPVGVAGTILSIMFLALSTCSTNLPMMILFYSILGGPALSMIWVSSQLIIGYYFDKFRPIANGVSCSGAGIGIMSFSYMNSVLLPLLGWRNVMRVHVAFLVVVLLMTMTFVEVAPTRIGKVKEALEESKSDLIEFYTGQTIYSRYSMRMSNIEYALDENFETVLEDSRVSKNHSTCDRCLQKLCPCMRDCLERRREAKAVEDSTRGYVIKQDFIEKEDMFYAGPRNYEKEQDKVTEIIQKLSTAEHPALPEGGWRTLSLESIENEYKRQTILKTLSTMKLPEQRLEKKYRQTYAELKLTKKRPLLAYLSPQNWIHPKITKAIYLLFDFRLLSVREFRILLLSAFLFPMGFNIPFVYSTERADIGSYAKLITPTIGFSNFAFRVSCGFIAYKYRQYTCFICGGAMFLGGVGVFISAFYGINVVWFQFLYAFVYGTAPAFFSTLRAIIYVQALGLDKLTNAFGLSSLAMGLGVFIGTTAGGIFNDLTGNFSASFAFAGICICASGAIKVLLPWLTKQSKAKAKK